MPKYADINIPRFDLANKSIELKIYEGNKVFGTLCVTKGCLYWYPRRTRRGYVIDIETFADLAEKHGERE